MSVSRDFIDSTPQKSDSGRSGHCVLAPSRQHPRAADQLCKHNVSFLFPSPVKLSKSVSAAGLVRLLLLSGDQHTRPGLQLVSVSQSSIVPVKRAPHPYSAATLHLVPGSTSRITETGGDIRAGSGSCTDCRASDTVATGTIQGWR
jgi:hypothetical protein